jgi:hypothetical protein
MGFVVNNVVIQRVFPQILQFPYQYNSANDPYSLLYLSPMVHKLNNQYIVRTHTQLKLLNRKQVLLSSDPVCKYWITDNSAIHNINTTFISDLHLQLQT